jgi:hypothetical protein
VQVISEEAVEAAAKAYYPRFWSIPKSIEHWDEEPESIKATVRNIVRPILEAAAPEMYAPIVALADSLTEFEEVPPVMIGIMIRAEVKSIIK